VAKKKKKSLKQIFSDSTSRQVAGRLIKDYVRPYVWLLVCAFSMMILVALATAGLAYGMEFVLNSVFETNARNYIPYIAGGVFLIFFVKGAASYGQSVIMNYVGLKIIADFQKQMFNKLVHADMSFFHNTSTGTLIARFTNDVGLLRAAVSTAITSAGRDFFSVIFLVAVMFHKDWILASVCFLAFPTAIFPIARFGRRLRKASSGSQEITGNLANLLNQVFQGARHVKAYSMEKYEEKRAGVVINELFGLTHRVARARAASHPIMELLAGAAMALVILYGGYQVLDGTRTIGAFFAFVTALLLAYEPMKKIANLNSDLQEGISAAVRVFDIIDRKPEIVDKPNAISLEIQKGGIQFNDVTFAYTTEKTTLKNISLNVEGGKMTALVGPSGGGKSTILNLIPRFYDVPNGEITVDGHNLKDVTLESLRSHMALVSQEVSLFDDTIRANIAYGRWSASEDDIIEAARNAAAHEFISKLPKGYDTIVGEHGIKLSGGQRQRISIARAMLKDAPILLLDEATSALDTESERKVQAALDKLMQGRTTLVIAHRLSTILNADYIYVIDQGEILEKGTHDDLLSVNGTYARLYNLQFMEENQGNQRNSVFEKKVPVYES
jgi:ATP-binding cassette, subfamily B, bacterial MsbA